MSPKYRPDVCFVFVWGGVRVGNSSGWKFAGCVLEVAPCCKGPKAHVPKVNSACNLGTPERSGLDQGTQEARLHCNNTSSIKSAP